MSHEHEHEHEHEHDQATALLAQISHQRSTQPLEILALADPILTSQSQSQSQSQQADDQTGQQQDQKQQQNDALRPSALAADLAHYRDLFSKLRFSYIEQVTKEKYLRAVIGGDAHADVDGEDNAALEERLAHAKTGLQARKRAAEELVGEVEALAARVAERYDAVGGQVRELEGVLAEVRGLEGEVRELWARVEREEQENGGGGGGEEGEGYGGRDDPRMHLSGEETLALLAEQDAREQELDRQIAALEAELQGKVAECEDAERDLEALERRRNEVTRTARDARRLREQGGRDRLGDQARWYAGSEVVLRGLLGIPS